MSLLSEHKNFYGRNLVGDVFIETGTYRCDSLALAVQAGYNELHSVEFVEEYVLAAREKFKDQPHVHLHHGSSPDVLPKIIDPSRQTTFWLDAHYQASLENEIDLNYGECPVLKELEIIYGFNWLVPPVVLIDDAHMFEKDMPKFKRSEWPLPSVLAAALPPGLTLTKLEDVYLVERAS